MTMLSFALLAPIALIVEGAKFTPAAMSAMGIDNPAAIIKKASIAAFMFHAYQQVSYMILTRVTPVTHSIGNCVKRCELI
jgi:solute carrier family 35, member E1